jgi:mannitol-1-phosphate 5-dehydrogenase
VSIGPVEIFDPAVPSDRELLIEALAEANEIGTAVPSVNYYRSNSPGSLHNLLAAGLRRKAALDEAPALIYAAENHNHAAEILNAAVMEKIPQEEQAAVITHSQFLNTVIGKMSGVISNSSAIRERGLTRITSQCQRAFLVETFNQILISRVQERPDQGIMFNRGIAVFEEKQDLLPFEEAKLYGHNATHALGAYIGALIGVKRFADLVTFPGVMVFLRDAFIEESGKAMIRKNGDVDALFSAEGYAQYAGDLLSRMTNPFLLDTIERIGRDPVRKLGWNDRLIGTIRLVLSQGVEPLRYAMGAAAAIVAIDDMSSRQLERLWCESEPSKAELDLVLSWIEKGTRCLQSWEEGGFGDPAKVVESI